MTPYIVITISAISIVVYQYASMRMREVTQPIRRDVVNIAERMCADPDFPQSFKPAIVAVSNSLLEKHLAWKFVFRFPITAIRKELPSESLNFASLSEKNAREFRTLLSMSLICILANSPLAILVYTIELAILSCLVKSIGLATGSAMVRTSMEKTVC